MIQRDPRASFPPSRAEQDLLLACSRTHLEEQDALRIRALAPQVDDWQTLIQTASDHKVWPLLARALATACPDVVPQTITEQLSRESLALGIRNLRVAKELLRIAKLLEAQGIPCLPYKGPLLAEAIYGDLSFRQFADLDILVPKQDVNTAVEAVSKLGYRLQLEGDTARQAYLQSMHHFTLVHETTRTILELHWDVAERYFAFSMPVHDLWERRQIAALIRQPVSTLCAEDLLTVLSIHGCKHGWEQLGLVCDIAELVRSRPDLDWDTALHRARDLGGERMVLLAFVLARRLLQAELPDAVRVRIEADPAAERLADEVQSGFFAAHRADPGTSERAQFLGFHMRARERAWDKARACLHLIFTPSQEDWESLQLPGWLAFLYYPLRPLRLAVKHARRLLRRE